jgi:hypothetical protein
MTEGLSFHIRGWAAWAPGRETEAAWRAWANGSAAPAAAEPATGGVPSALRRRISPLGQAALRSAWGLPDAAAARIVSTSRHGEFARTLSILDSLALGEDVSPADFTLSVHHALAGVLSIAQGNRRGHTAVAAGHDSFGFGLIEAVTALAERPDEPVVLLHYDEPLPPPYSDLATAPGESLALALSLASLGNNQRFALTIAPGRDERPSPAPALDFLRFMLKDDPAMISRGERMQWHWRRHAAAA